MTLSQTQFHSALLDPQLPTPQGLSDGQGREAGRRFSVYRNNVAHSLTEALEQSFPAIQMLIGAENFKSVAGVFLRQSPPKTPIMMHYGSEFPDFLQGFEPFLHLEYLPDVARLEQAIRLSYHAADAAPIAPDALQAISPDDLAEARLSLAPALRLQQSPWPIHAIWAFNLEEGAPKPRPGPQNVLITRTEFDPELTPIPSGTAAFIAALQADETLTDAADEGTEKDAEFDLSQALALLLSTHSIIGIKPRAHP